MLPLIHLDDTTAIVVDSIAWLVLSIIIGSAAHRAPVARLTIDSFLTRLRSFERDGRWYERRLGIKRWKDRLPEAGDLFGGGVSKRRLAGRSRSQLDRFVAETRRAEYTHWGLLAAAPFFALWNRPFLAVCMLLFALVANGPCLLVQRYNRARLLRILDRTPRQIARPVGLTS